MTPQPEWADLLPPEPAPPPPAAPAAPPRPQRPPPRETRGERAARLARQAARQAPLPAPSYGDEPLTREEAAALYALGWIDQTGTRTTPGGVSLVRLRAGYPRGAGDDYEPPEIEMTPGGWRQVIADGRRP